MFSVNKGTRHYIKHNFISVRNGYKNDGLIDFVFSSETITQFNNYEKLETVYFQALKRNLRNRIITFRIDEIDEEELSSLKEVADWIKG